jgi:hypothetical protein
VEDLLVVGGEEEALAIAEVKLSLFRKLSRNLIDLMRQVEEIFNKAMDHQRKC